jgi:hypothetical protein
MNRSYLIATALALGITAWMLAGYLVTEPANEAASESQPSVQPPELMAVEVSVQKARQVTRHIVAQGQVEPNRTVTVRAEAAGKIAEVVTEEGRAVQADDVLVHVELDDRQIRLNKAEALVREWQRAHEGADRLGEKGYQSQRLIDETYSELQSAQAELEEIRLEFARTTIRAPFDGILETRRIELGDYVAVNGEIATIVDNDPLVVAVQIAQQKIEDIALGDVAAVAFAMGQEGEGLVRYIAPRAEEATRTFRVEIVRFANPLLATFEMRVFTPDQSEEAVNWAAELPRAPERETGAFRFLPTTKNDVLAFEIDGVISAGEMPGVIEELEAFLGRHEKVRILNRMKHFGGIDPGVFVQGGLVSMKLAAMQKVQRYAIVGAPVWMGKIIDSLNPAFADVDMRTFPAEQEADAWAWLGVELAK